MILALIGLLAGVIIGAIYPITIPLIYARYTAVGIIGLLDSVIGALRANMQGKYNVAIFISGVVFNMILAMTVTYFGDKLSLDLYLAVLVVFMLRIFKNIGQMRYRLLIRFLGKRRVTAELKVDHHTNPLQR